MPLATLAGHAHWVWQVRFNPAHDALLLSSSSDATVQLWHVDLRLAAAGKLVTSSPLKAEAGTQRDGTQHGKASAGGHAAVVSRTTFEDHEDSVYGAAWSVSDPFVFATLSIDGRLVVQRVSNSVKYQVIL